MEELSQLEAFVHQMSEHCESGGSGPHSQLFFFSYPLLFCNSYTKELFWAMHDIIKMLT